MAKRKSVPMDVITAPFRASFVNLIEPQIRNKGKATERPEWNCMMVLPEDHEFWEIAEDLLVARCEEQGLDPEDAAHWPIKRYMPKKGKAGPEFDGMLTCSIKSYSQVPLFDMTGKETTDRRVIYSGAWLAADINPGYWDGGESGPGVSLFVNSVIRARTPEGESDDAFGRGKVDAAKTFGNLVQPGGSGSGDDDGEAPPRRQRRRRQPE